MTGGWVGTFSTIRLIAWRELRERGRTRGYVLGTIVIAALLVAVVLLPVLFDDEGDAPPEWAVAVAGQRPITLDAAIGEFAQIEAADITLRSVDADEVAALVEEEAVDAAIVDSATILVRDDTPQSLQRVLLAALDRALALERLEAAGVSAEQAAAVLGGSPIAISVVGEDIGERAQREFVAFLGVVALFTFIAMYGTWVLYSVIEEKANRVVELVVATVRPSQLLAGKVIGVGALGLAQLVLAGGLAAGVAVAVDAIPTLPAGVTTMAASSVLWFLLGFAFYAVAYAAAGSLASRQEDAQSAATPMVLFVLLAYFVSLFVVTPNPDSTVARVVSFIPPITPLAMPARQAAGVVPVWELAAAVAVMAAATWLMVLLAGRVYANAILRTGARVPIREAIRRPHTPTETRTP